ncbi:MAG: ribonuclease P protein component, partial [Candidatus Marinimicrobia bacterium]|nr:ribonuclease P protein component [Candidatus Neomarinimicrobiota bacterium]
IISRGKSIKYDNLYISILPQSAWALSIVVKKNSGKACQRNEFERKIRESFRLCKPYCPNPAAVAVTVLRKPQKIDVNKLTELFKDNINNPSR